MGSYKRQKIFDFFLVIDRKHPLDKESDPSICPAILPLFDCADFLCCSNIAWFRESTRLRANQSLAVGNIHY
jgi:hypothetical protein